MPVLPLHYERQKSDTACHFHSKPKSDAITTRSRSSQTRKATKVNLAWRFLPSHLYLMHRMITTRVTRIKCFLVYQISRIKIISRFQSDTAYHFHSKLRSDAITTRSRSSQTRKAMKVNLALQFLHSQ